MAMGVVDILEMVKIGKDQTERGTVPFRAVHGQIEHAENCAVIQHPCEWVVPCLHLKGGASLKQLSLFQFQLAGTPLYKLLQPTLSGDISAQAPPPE